MHALEIRGQNVKNKKFRSLSTKVTVTKMITGLRDACLTFHNITLEFLQSFGKTILFPRLDTFQTKSVKHEMPIRKLIKKSWAFNTESEKKEC